MYIDIQKETSYEGLVHAVMEAEKSYDLPSVNWRLREASGPFPNPKAGGPGEPMV